jgi:hypothetical protein
LPFFFVLQIKRRTHDISPFKLRKALPLPK